MSIILNSEHEYRGYLINEFTKLERALDKHLLFHFFPNDDVNSRVCYRMHEVLLDRMTFDGKRTAVKGILDNKSVSEGFIKTKNNSYPNGKLFDEVRQLIEIRNFFAHYLSVVSHRKDTVIVLLQFRDSTKLFEYTQADFDDLVNRIVKATNDILGLIKPEGAGL